MDVEIGGKTIFVTDNLEQLVGRDWMEGILTRAFPHLPTAIQVTSDLLNPHNEPWVILFGKSKECQYALRPHSQGLNREDSFSFSSTRDTLHFKVST